MLGNQQARPRRAPGFEIGMRPCRIFERITLADGDLHRTVLDHLEHTRCARGALDGPVVIVEQGRAGDDMRPAERKSVEQGKSVSVRVALGGRRIIKKTEKPRHTMKTQTDKHNTLTTQT